MKQNAAKNELLNYVMIFLFQQPESSHHGDCPICCLPIPLVGKSKFATTECCSKMIYEGCIFTDKYCQWEMKGQLRNFPFECLFCGHSLPKAQQEGGLTKLTKRVATAAKTYSELLGPNEMSRCTVVLSFIYSSQSLGGYFPRMCIMFYQFTSLKTKALCTKKRQQKRVRRQRQLQTAIQRRVLKLGTLRQIFRMNITIAQMHCNKTRKKTRRQSGKRMNSAGGAL